MARVDIVVMEDASAITSLPDDPQALKQIIFNLSKERDQRAKERDDWHVKFLRVETELLRLKKWYYGPRADRLQQPGEVAQLLLGFGEQLESRPVNPADMPAEAATAHVDAKEIRRVKKGRRNLAAFENLPVVRRVYDLAAKACPCCGEERQKIGEESSWQIEYIPGRFERIEHVRIKYACKRCEQKAENPRIELAAKPSHPIDKGMAGPGLLAYAITSKYADYVPLYRLQNIFSRNGFEISRATQSVWCGDVADLLRPLYDLMVQRVLESHVICTDDTVMPMLWPEKTKPARMWVYVGDEHNPYNVFEFTLSRSRDGPTRFLKDYRHTLLADAYGGYDGIVVGNDITRAGCWAHGRRKFVDAEKSHPQIAAEAVGWIRRLYAVEERGKALEVAARRALRQQESVPILSSLKDRLFAWRDQLLPKHPMSEAVGYLLNQWTQLNVFTTDGAVPIDNNISEREMKRICLNRKNSLFVGNERGGETAAILSSLTSTCRRHAIDPQHYLTQLLTNLPDTPMSRLSGWLPDAWKKNHPAPPRV